MSDALDLDALEQVAKAATPGPWEVDDAPIGKTKCIYGPPGALPGQGRELAVAERVFGRDARFISTFDPPTCLALIARLRAAEAERDHWHAVANRQRGDVSTLRAAVADLADEWRVCATDLDADGLHDDADRLRRRWTELRALLSDKEAGE